MKEQIKTICVVCGKHFSTAVYKGIHKKKCPECWKTHRRLTFIKSNHNRKEQVKIYNDNRTLIRLANKVKAIEYLGGCCFKCGVYDDDPAIYDFHHENPKEKLIGGVARLLSLKTWETIKRELDKCTLVCSNCHRKIHRGNQKI